MSIRFCGILGMCIVAVLAASVRAGETVPNARRRQAVEWLAETINDPDELPVALAGLRSTSDPALLPVFVELTRHEEKEIRLMATAMIADIGQADAAEALRERLKNDPSMVIRGEALIHLAQLDAVETDDIIEASKLPDLGLQVIAARTLARQGQADRARDLLRKLAESRDLDTEVFARMTLLDLGETDQIPRLRDIVIDPDTSTDLLMRMLNQIRDEKITKALPVARYLAKPAHLLPVRISAYWAIAELDENPTDELAAAIGREDNLLLQLNLLRMLAEQDNAQPHLDGLSMAEDTIGVVAAFEVARRSSKDKLPAAIQAVVAEGHPVVIDYVLNRFRQDSQAEEPAAEAYVQPLLAYLADLKLSRNRMTPNHDRGAAAVELLANHGSHAALAGLDKLLDGTGNTPRRQLVAGALYRSTNAGAVDLVRPLLDSAYSELYTYAALVVARHGVDAAIPVLLKIQDHKDITRPDVLVLANWYLIKLSGMTAPSVNSLVESIE